MKFTVNPGHGKLCFQKLLTSFASTGELVNPADVRVEETIPLATTVPATAFFLTALAAPIWSETAGTVMHYDV